MGKALSLLRPPQPPREGEKEGAMELRRRPRERRVDPDFVSSPPRQLLKKRAHKQAPSKRPREAAEVAKQQWPRKRARFARLGVGLHPSSCFRMSWPHTLPKPTHVFRPRHPFNWYEPDMWTEIARHLCGFDLVCLSLTSRWFHRLLADESIWRYAFMRDLYLLRVTYVPPPRPLHRSWRRLYAAAFDGSHSFCRHQSHRHIDGSRIGGFLLDTPCMLLAGKLPLPRCVLDEAQLSIELMGACVLRNARPGIWIADMHLVRCPACNYGCLGVMQILEVRHSELFLEEGYQDGTWEYEDFGDHFMDVDATAACCAVFANANAHSSSSYANILCHTKYWIRERSDWQPRTCCTPYAVAVNTNLKEDGGLLTKFEGMRDVTGDGQIVSIRITQRLV